MSTDRKLIALFVAAVAAVSCVSAADSSGKSAGSPAVTSLESTPPADDANGPTVELPSFTVSTQRDDSYVGKSALSSTRIAVAIVDLPQSVKVLNSNFLKAVNPFNLADVLNYTGGAQNV